YELGRRGHPVAVLDIDTDAAERVAAQLRDAGVPALGLSVDVTDRGAVDEAMQRVRDELGPVAILVTSAGKVAFGKFTEITGAQWSEMMDINLTGTFNCCQAALPDMLAARWGRIVMISSSSAQRGSPYMAHYAVSKGAVITLTRCLANEYASKGITVNNIPPSSIDTPMARQSQSTGNLFKPEDLAKRIPVGHMGTPEDIAAAVGYLCSEEAGFVTGQVLGVNGGAVI
ncbi:MAG: SDR family NAD(P)-dependent oxidoreductase, partial [Gordonia amarae]